MWIRDSSHVYVIEISFQNLVFGIFAFQLQSQIGFLDLSLISTPVSYTHLDVYKRQAIGSCTEIIVVQLHLEKFILGIAAFQFDG